MNKSNDNSFLDEGYEIPSNSPYMKFQDGDNTFRILSKPIIGWEDWTLDKKPVRFTMANKPTHSIDPKKPIKHFWAFIVWNYALEQIQILEITQKGIQESIKNLARHNRWGNPSRYDITVTRKGSGMETEYTVTPCPHEPLQEVVKKAFAEKPIELEQLYEGADPFEIKTEVTELLTDLPF
ncbi:MAG: hypothetical protein KGI54_18385 [Pseudomonadota bacterium]|nr:hypothetical protein [Pseudomonadota bacterium]